MKKAANENGMKKILEIIWKLLKNCVEFLKSSRHFFRLTLIFHLIILIGLVPALVKLTDFLLTRKDIDYLSYANVLSIFTQHPLTGFALSGVVLLILIIAFIEFNFLTLLVYFVKKKQKVTLRQLIYLSLTRILRLRPTDLLFFLLYFVLILPLSNIGGRLDILSNIKIPNFVLVYVLTGSKLFLLAYVIVSLASLYLAWRLIFTLPLIILQKVSLHSALSKSWKLSKKHFWSFLLQYLALTGLLNGLFWTLSFGLSSLQNVLETHSPSFGFLLAMLNMLIIQGAALIRIVLALVVIFYLILTFLESERELNETVSLSNHAWLEKSHRFLSGLLSLAFVLVSLAFTILSNNSFLSTNPLADNPLIISHRGVSDGNGVQNTIPALEKTSQTYHPDYVEMDIRQTADHQFVVMHDSNLKSLTGVDKKVNQMTLSELTSLTVKENGKSAPLASFDEYLKAADQRHQRLLIEIKTYSQDNVQQITTNFIHRYGQEIIKNGDKIHTLNFQVAEALKAEEPQLDVSYIIVYNLLGIPETGANAFSVETSTLSQSFVAQAHRQGKKVYAWDVNDVDTIQRMRLYHVDGLITDNVGLVHESVTANGRQMTYAQKLRIYLLNYDNSSWGDLLFNNINKNSYEM